MRREQADGRLAYPACDLFRPDLAGQPLHRHLERDRDSWRQPAQHAHDVETTFAGLKTDARARVLGGDGAPIAGLYAAGTDMASVMGGHYPAGGINLGPAMTFGYIAGRDAAAVAGKHDARATPSPEYAQ